MIREKIDIHNTSRRYHQAIETLKKDKSVSEKNKQFIVQFLKDAELGKTVLKKQKKKIGKRACLKYFYLLKTSMY